MNVMFQLDQHVSYMYLYIYGKVDSVLQSTREREREEGEGEKKLDPSHYSIYDDLYLI